MFEDRIQAVGFQFSRLLCPDFVDGFVQVHRDVKPIQHMDGLASLLCDYLQVRLPHVAAYEQKSLGSFLAKHPEKAQQCLDGPVLPDPKQSFIFRVSLINHGQVLVAALPENLVDSDRVHLRERSRCARPHSTAHSTA